MRLSSCTVWNKRHQQKSPSTPSHYFLLYARSAMMERCIKHARPPSWIINHVCISWSAKQLERLLFFIFSFSFYVATLALDVWMRNSNRVLSSFSPRARVTHSLLPSLLILDFFFLQKRKGNASSNQINVCRYATLCCRPLVQLTRIPAAAAAVGRWWHWRMTRCCVIILFNHLDDLFFSSSSSSSSLGFV